MPTLPAAPEVPEGPAERIGAAMRRAGAAIGVDRHVSVRALVCFVAVTVAIAVDDAMWADVVGMLGVIGLALDWMRRPGS